MAQEEDGPQSSESSSSSSSSKLPPGMVLGPDGKPIPPDAYPMARALKGERQPPVEFSRRAPDGRLRTLLNTTAPLRDDRGELLGAVAISIEITALKEKESELRQARDERAPVHLAQLAVGQRQLAAQAVEPQRIGELHRDATVAMAA